MENETVSITLNGVVDESKWLDWISDAKGIFEMFGYRVTHIGIQSQKFTSGKIMSMAKQEKKIFDALMLGDFVRSISLFALPENYKSASFDYEMMIVCNQTYISLIVNKSKYQEEYEKNILNILSNYIDAQKTEIYEMDKSESPLIYALKANPISSFKTLKIIKEL